MKAFRVVAVVLLVAVAVVWGTQTVRKAQRSTGNDLVAYLAASEALYAGGDPYHLPERFPYIYPLFLAAVIRPLAALPVAVASVAWFLLECACLLFVLRGTRLRLGRTELTGAVAVAAIVAVFGDVLQIELLNGQVNLLVLALAVAAFLPSSGGSLSLGAAIALKLTPGLLLVPWLVERRVGAALKAVAWAAALVLLPWLIVGDRLWTLYSGYLHEFVLARTQSVDGGHIVFSVYGVWTWLTGASPGRGVMLVLAAAVIGALIAWQLRHKGTPFHIASLYLAATPLLSPMSEVHHLTAAIPLAAVAGSRARRASVLVPLALFTILLWAGRLDRRGPWYFFALIALIAAGCMALRENPAQD